MNAWKLGSVLAGATLVSGCAGMATSNFNYDSQLQVNAPRKTDGCYDAAVLLGANRQKTQEIMRKVLVAVDAKIEAETDDSINAQRNRHIGLFVGSGGEEIFLKYKPVTPERTYVTVATKTGFVGGAGQKAWSCQVVDEMVKMAR
jgi:hypothetical protein